MAEQQDDIEVTEGDGGGGKSKLLIIVIAVLVLALAGVGAMLLLGGDDEAASDDEAAEVMPAKAPAIYYTVETPFNINFSKQSNNEVRFLQVKLKVMARDQLIIDAFKLHLPAIQHELLLLFYGQKYDDLNSAGTKALQQAVLAKANQVLKAEQIEDGLEAIYFTSFLMQ
ncbi:MAG: flagellar basal body-associated protein FliL [Methylophagaceae bacterium]